MAQVRMLWQFLVILALLSAVVRRSDAAASTCEVQVKRTILSQMAVVNQGDQIYVCCGQCVSRESVIVKVSDPYWAVGLFKINYTFQFFVKRMTGATVAYSDQLGRWSTYMNHRETGKWFDSTKLELTMKSMCDWLSDAILQHDVSMVSGRFLIDTEFAIDVRLQTGSHRNEFLECNTKWLGAVTFVNDLDSMAPETKSIAKKTVQEKNQVDCADGSCGIMVIVSMIVNDQIAVCIAGFLLVLAPFGLLFFCGASMLVTSRILERSKRAVASELIGNQAVSRRHMDVQTGEECTGSLADSQLVKTAQEVNATVVSRDIDSNVSASAIAPYVAEPIQVAAVGDSVDLEVDAEQGNQFNWRPFSMEINLVLF